MPPRRSKDSGRRAQGAASNAVWNLPAAFPNHIWSYDFVAVRSRRGASIRILNVVDEFTRVAIGAHVAPSIGARDVWRILEQLFERHGAPHMIRSDNGREFIAATVVDGLRARGITPVFIERGSPQQNPFVERFNGTMRDELLNGEEFDSVLEARVVIGRWLAEYNEHRPHRGLGMLTPAAYAAAWNEGS